jgi:NAD(P)-dependent dehydrogenase (short-subunit alcohol dehydrogenase family)
VTARRVALIADAANYVGPALARLLAQRDHDLVLGDADPVLVDELTDRGVEVEAVAGVTDLARPDATSRLVDAALARFGRLDAAAAASGRIIGGRFVDSTEDDFAKVIDGCMMAPYHFLRAAVPPMVARGSGQVLVITSAAAARPTPGAPLYSAARAGATMLAKNVAGEVARHGVQVNAVGTNFMDFPAFLAATGATDPAVRERIEAQVPMRRLGTMEEFAAFCAVFLDGTSTFTTGQFVAYAGGWA